MASRLNRVFSRLGEKQFSGTLEVYQEGEKSGGRALRTYDEPVPVDFFTVPDGDDTAEMKADSGSQITDNRHFYFIGIITIKQLSLLTYNDTVYEIRGPEPRPHGNFTYAYGKNITRSKR